MTGPTVISGIDEVKARIGQELGVSRWHTVTQDDINQFADVTGDPQWIHVDVERAAQSPFGGTIAHGLYTLSLGPKFCGEIFALDGFAFGMNYGYNRVRFPAPLHVGRQVRMRATLSAADEIPGGHQVTLTGVFEADDGGKPVCAAEMLFRLFSPPADDDASNR